LVALPSGHAQCLIFIGCRVDGILASSDRHKSHETPQMVQDAPLDPPVPSVALLVATFSAIAGGLPLLDIRH
jgi:hypothetical protein